MALFPISLGKGSSPARHGVAGITRHVNCYLEQTGSDAKVGEIVVASDGLATWTTLASVGIRAALEVGAYLYVVSGRQVYRVDQAGSSTVLGGLPTDGPVYMARNRRSPPQIGIVSGGLFFVIDTNTNAYTQVQDVDLPPATSLAVLDGYGILPVSNSKWFTTDLDDFTAIDGLAFGSAESNPDEIVRAATRESEVVIFGTLSTEWYQDTGGEDFAFQRVQTAEIGCLAAGSVARVDRTLMWVAHDFSVRIMEGYGGKVVSNDAVSREIEADNDKSNITATSWYSNGHTFYALNLSNSTWVYDLTTGQWHNRESYGSNRWRCSLVTRFGNRLIAGDRTTGDLYLMSKDYYDEAGDPLIFEVLSPPVHAAPYRLSATALHIDILPGVGLNSSSPELLDPEIMVRWSDDGGASWSGERRAALGRLGKTVTRAVLRRLGIINRIGRTFRFSISAAVARAITGAHIEAEKLKV